MHRATYRLAAFAALLYAVACNAAAQAPAAAPQNYKLTSRM